jgi:hypothetical protein
MSATRAVFADAKRLFLLGRLLPRRRVKYSQKHVMLGGEFMFRTRVSRAVALILLVMGGIWASAQVTRPFGTRTVDPLSLVAPTVITGSDLGFRIESTKDNIPVGKIVVRIDGHWVEAQVGTSGIMPADAR